MRNVKWVFVIFSALLIVSAPALAQSKTVVKKQQAKKQVSVKIMDTPQGDFLPGPELLPETDEQMDALRMQDPNGHCTEMKSTKPCGLNGINCKCKPPWNEEACKFMEDADCKNWCCQKKCMCKHAPPKDSKCFKDP